MNYVFLCGPISNDKLNSYEQFKRLEEAIRALVIYVPINPHDLADGNFSALTTKMGSINIAPIRKGDEGMLNKQIALMSFCDEVVTIKGWEENFEAQQIVRAARIMNKDVTPYTTFLTRNHEQSGTSTTTEDN